jgi:hypothetical protein
MICSDNDVEKFCWYCLICYVHMNLNYRFLSIFLLYVKNIEHRPLVSFLLLTSIYRNTAQHTLNNIDNLDIILLYRRMIFSVSTNWPWYWQLSVNVQSSILWRYRQKKKVSTCITTSIAARLIGLAGILS